MHAKGIPEGAEASFLGVSTVGKQYTVLFYNTGCPAFAGFSSPTPAVRMGALQLGGILSIEHCLYLDVAMLDWECYVTMLPPNWLRPMRCDSGYPLWIIHPQTVLEKLVCRLKSIKNLPYDCNHAEDSLFTGRELCMYRLCKIIWTILHNQK